jgi:peptidoglycan hydrolase-like protein with peptidoglycan-binding domain
MGASGSAKMKVLLTICLLLISTPFLARAQQSGKQHASLRATGGAAGETPALPTLTRTQTREAERRLSDMGYWTGAVDGLLDPATRSALIAFQKWEARPITGQLTLDELEAIRTSAPPKARELGYEHVEVDLDRQVLLMVNDEGGVRALPVSTGSDKPFVDEGQNSIGYTPRGRFVVYDKGVGWETGSLGSVYYANYISGGIAIHGSRNVPTKPVSHGCIRIPMFAAREMSKLLRVGTIVLVYDKISFVSAKSWVEHPQLKQAGLLISASDGYTEYADGTKSRSRSFAIKKARSKVIRA